MTETLLPIGLLLISMTSIQIGASLAHYLFEAFGVNVATLLRLVISSFILIAIYRPKMRGYLHKGSKYLLGYGFALGLMNLSFYHALHTLPLGIAVAIEFLGPLSIAIFTSRKAIDALWVSLSVVGFVIFLPLKETSENLDLTGIFFALLAGFFWALYILLGRRVDQSQNSGANTSVGMVIASLVALPMGLIEFKPELFNSRLIIISIGVAVLSSAIPYTLEMYALKKMSARTFSIFLSLEPALAAFAGLIFIGEHLSVYHCLGMLSLMIASAGSALTDFQKRTAEV